MSPRRPLNRNFPQFTEANPSIFCSAWVNKHFQTSAEVVVSMLLSELWPVTFHNSCLTEVLLCLFEPFLLSLPLFVSFSLFQMHIHANTHTNTHWQLHTDPLPLHTHTHKHAYTHSFGHYLYLTSGPSCCIYITSNSRTLVVHWQGNVPVTRKWCIINSHKPHCGFQDIFL